MSNSYQKIASILLYVLLAVGVVAALIFYLGPKDPATVGTPNEIPSFTDSMLIISYIFVGITALLALVFPIYFIFTHPANAKFILIGLGAFIIVLLVAYALGSSEPIPGVTTDLSDRGMKLVDGGLIAAYIFMGITFAGIAYSEISSIFK